MAQLVRMPDGKTVSFPDDMPKEEIRALIEDKFPDAATKAADPKVRMFDKIAEKAQDLKANQAPIFEAVIGGLDAGGGLSPKEEASGDWERNQMLPRAVNHKTGEQKLAVPGMAMAAYDLFKVPHDVATGDLDPMSDEGIAKATELALMMTPGAPKASPAKMLGNTLAVVPRQSKALVPTAAELKQVAQTAYDAAKGSEIAAGATPDLVKSLYTVLDKEGLVRPDGKLTSTFGAVKTAMRDFDAYSGKPMSFEQFQRLEEALQGVAGSKAPGESRIGKMLLNELDKYFAALPDGSFTKGSGSAAKAGYAGGKEGWAQYSKLRKVEKAISNAELAKGGFTEGLRAEFRTILKSDRKSLGFTDDELKMMRQFVQGGKLDQVTGWLSGLRGMVAGGLSGGIVGALALPAAGSVVKSLGGSNAKKTAKQLRASIAQGNSLKTAAGAPKAGNTLSLAGPLANAGTRALGAGGESEAERGGLLQSLRLSAAGL